MTPLPDIPETLISHPRFEHSLSLSLDLPEEQNVASESQSLSHLHDPRLTTGESAGEVVLLPSLFGENSSSATIAVPNGISTETVCEKINEKNYPVVKTSTENLLDTNSKDGQPSGRIPLTIKEHRARRREMLLIRRRDAKKLETEEKQNNETTPQFCEDKVQSGRIILTEIVTNYENDQQQNKSHFLQTKSSQVIETDYNQLQEKPSIFSTIFLYGNESVPLLVPSTSVLNTSQQSSKNGWNTQRNKIRSRSWPPFSLSKFIAIRSSTRIRTRNYKSKEEVSIEVNNAETKKRLVEMAANKERTDHEYIQSNFVTQWNGNDMNIQNDDTKSDVHILRAQLEKFRQDSVLTFAKVNRAEERIVDLERENKRLTEARHELKMEIANQKEIHQKQLQDTQLEHERRIEQLNQKGLQLIMAKRRLLQELDDEKKRVQNLTKEKDELKAEQMNALRLQKSIAELKEQLQEEKSKTSRIYWSKVMEELQKVTLEKVVEEMTTKYDTIKKRETDLMKELNEVSRLAMQLEEDEKKKRNQTKDRSREIDKEEDQVKNECKKQNALKEETKANQLALPSAIESVIETTCEGCILTDGTLSDRTNHGNYQNQSRKVINESQDMKDVTSTHECQYSASTSPPNMTEKHEPSLRERITFPVDSEHNLMELDVENETDSNSQGDEMAVKTPSLLKKLRNLDESLSRTEDAFLDLVKTTKNGSGSISVDQFARFVMDELKLFLGPLQSNHSPPSACHQSSGHSRAEESPTESNHVMETDPNSFSLLQQPYNPLSGVKEIKNAIPYETSPLTATVVKDSPLPSLCDLPTVEGYIETPRINPELFRQICFQSDSLTAIHEKQVTEFIKNRSFKPEITLRLTNNGCIPIGRSANNVVLVGPSLTPSPTWLKSLWYSYQQVLTKIIPSVDHRLSADVEAWKELLMETTDAGQILRMTQLIDPKGFKQMELEGKQFMPTTDTFLYLVEYLALAMQPHQKTIVIVCSYMCHIDDRDLEYLRRSLLVQNLSFSSFKEGDYDNQLHSQPPSFEKLEGPQILLSDFLSGNEERNNEVTLSTISVRRLLSLSQLMKVNTELEIILDTGGSGIEAYWGATRKGGLYHLSRLEQSARVLQSSAVRGGTVTVKRLQPLDLTDDEGCGHRDINLCHMITMIQRSCLGLCIKCNFR